MEENKGRFKKGHPIYCKHHTTKTKEILSEQRKGKNNPIFGEGGIDRVRETIKKRYSEGVKMGFQLLIKTARNEIVYPVLKCEECGGKKSLKVHHIDGDRSNHLWTNLECLCNSCHIKRHYKPYLYSITKYHFDSSHSLEGMGKCSNDHGHRWFLLIKIGNRLKGEGIVEDFRITKETVNTSIIQKLDHTCLNEKFSFPSAEWLTIWIFLILCKKLKGLKQVEIYESEEASVSMTDKFFLEMLGE